MFNNKLFCIHRHIELSSNVANAKFVFTVINYGSMSQGKIGFNNLQVNIIRKKFFFGKK